MAALYGKPTGSGRGGRKLGGRSLRESRGRGECVSQSDGDSNMAPAYVRTLRRGRAPQRNADSASSSVWEKVALPALAPKPDGSVPPRVSRAFFQQLPQRGNSERASPAVVSPRGPLIWTPAAPRLTQPQSLLVFTVRSCGDFAPWYRNPGPGSLVWSWDRWLLRGHLHCPEVPPDF